MDNCSLPKALVQDIMNFVDVAIARGAVRGPEITAVAIIREALAKSLETGSPQVTIVDQKP